MTPRLRVRPKQVQTFRQRLRAAIGREAVESFPYGQQALGQRKKPMRDVWAHVGKNHG